MPSLLTYLKQDTSGKRLSVVRPMINSVMRRIHAHIEEILAGSAVRELAHDTEFQLSKNAANNVEGWLTDIEGALLYCLAKKCNANGVIAEIGSWKGRSTVFLAKGSKAGQRVIVYAIDPHEGAKDQGLAPTFDEFEKNIASAQVDDIVVSIVKTSEEAANDFLVPCALIFVDGCHEPDSVKQDFALWYPKLIEGGIMAFHDTLDYIGPRMLVKDLLYKSNNFKNVRFARSITYGTKVVQNKMADQIKNRFFLLLNSIYTSLRKIGLIMSDRTEC
jgi:MMP 1-O-methyltransferase